MINDTAFHVLLRVVVFDLAGNNSKPIKGGHYDNAGFLAMIGKIALKDSFYQERNNGFLRSDEQIHICPFWMNHWVSDPLGVICNKLIF
jgi:hypothetical protein